MVMWGWILKLVKGPGGVPPRRSPEVPNKRENGKATARGGPQTSLDEAFPGPLPGLQNLDGQADAAEFVVLVSEEDELFHRIDVRIRSGRFELPQMPSTSRALTDLVSNPSIDAERIVEAVRVDPVLSSEVLKLANSVSYAARVPADTLQQAIVRVGRRPLRGMILALSMRGVVFMVDEFRPYAEEAFRQAYSVGTLCRVVAAKLGIERERAFLLGLLHDVGKIALLHMLWKEVGSGTQVTQGLVGKLYMRYHEAAGLAMAESWKLSDEIISVTSCHHDFEANADHPRSAALVSLAHRMDLALSLGDQESYEALVESREAQFLDLNAQTMVELLEQGRQEFVANHTAAAKRAA